MRTSKLSNHSKGVKKFGPISKSIAVVLAIAVLNLTFSCSYYNVRSVPVEEGNVKEEIHRLNQSKNYAIVHQGGDSWHLNNMVIDDDDYILSGKIKPISSRHTYESIRNSKRVHKYKADRTEPLTEIHFYLKSNEKYSYDEEVRISFSDIYEISVNDPNNGRTILNVALWTVGGTAIAAGVILLIFALFKSSCPFVYVKDGDSYVFSGELYPGIITPTMQRDDFLPLPDLQLEDGYYQLQITNELKEKQYTDVLELVEVQHDPSVSVYIDEKGKLHTVLDPQAPREIQIDGQNYNPAAVLKKDQEYYGFDSHSFSENSSRNMVLQFDRPAGSSEAKLVLSAKNSMWLDFMFGKFNEQFGTYYNTFQKEQQTVPNTEITQWLEKQHIPLSVYVKQNGNWQLVEALPSFGPLATRDLVVPIPLDMTASGSLDIKLETGFMFWDVDFVGMDFTVNAPLKIIPIQAEEAIDQFGIDHVDEIRSVDGDYLAQEHIGDRVDVLFKAPEQSDSTSKTFFLKNRGYYNYVREYTGIPNFAWLKGFREAGAFTRFSETAYFNFLSTTQDKEAAYAE